MKWFYSLKRVIRVIIAVASWLPLFIFAGVIGEMSGDNDLLSGRPFITVC